MLLGPSAALGSAGLSSFLSSRISSSGSMAALSFHATFEVSKAMLLALPATCETASEKPACHSQPGQLSKRFLRWSLHQPGSQGTMGGDPRGTCTVRVTFVFLGLGHLGLSVSAEGPCLHGLLHSASPEQNSHPLLPLLLSPLRFGFVSWLIPLSDHPQASFCSLLTLSQTAVSCSCVVLVTHRFTPPSTSRSHLPLDASPRMPQRFLRLNMS